MRQKHKKTLFNGDMPVGSRPVCQEIIGLDKIQFYNLGIDREDGLKISHLMKHKNVKIEEASGDRICIRHIPNSTKGIAKIIITDNQIFQDMVIGCSYKKNGVPHEYVYLTITVENARGDNFEPMSYKEYCDYLNSVFRYIADEYRICLCSDYVKVRYLEINTNIPLEKKFELYDRPLRLLMSFLNKRYGKLSSYDSVSGSENDTTYKGESFKRGNQSIQLVIYDKTKQMKDRGYEVDEDFPQYLRIEYRLLNSKKIEADLGSRFWNDIDDLIIADYFIKKFRNEFIRKYEKWVQKREKIYKD